MLRARRQITEAVVEYASCNGLGAMVWDRDLRLCGVNPEAGKYLDLAPAEQLQGTPYKTVRSAIAARNSAAGCGEGWTGCLAFDSFDRIVDALNDAKGRIDTIDTIASSGRRLRVRHMLLQSNWLVTQIEDLSGQNQKEVEAEAQRMMLEATLGTLTDGVMVTNAQDDILHCNPSFFHLFDADPEGYRPGMNVVDFALLHGDLQHLSPEQKVEAAESRANFARGLSESNVINRELGNGRFVRIWRTRLAHGGVVMTATDVTSNVLMARQKKILELTLEGVSDGVIMMDENQIVTAYNQRILEILGIDRRVDPRGLHVRESCALHRDLRDASRDIVQREMHMRSKLITGGYHDGKAFTICRPMLDGTPIEIRRMPVDDGGAVISIRDVSDRESLARQRRQLEATVENLSDGFMMLDPNGRITAVNPRMFELYRVDHGAAAVGDHVSVMVRANGDLSDMTAEERAVALDERLSFALSLNDIPGESTSLRSLSDGKTLQLHSVTLEDLSAVIVIRDVSDQVDLMNATEKLELLSEHNRDGILMVSQVGRIDFVNESFHALFDVGADTAKVGDTIEEMIAATSRLDHHAPEEQARIIAERAAFILEPSSEPKRKARRLSNGTSIEITRLPVSSGGAIIRYRDMTSDKERQSLLDAARSTAEDMSRLKSEFVARLTHELRTPMHGVLGIAALLQRSGLNDRQLRFLETLQRSGQHMVDLIDGLLTVSTLETGDLVLDVDRCDLQDMVSDCAEMLRPKAEEKGLTFDVSATLAVPTAMADRTRLTQIVVNLLNNAVKFTNDGTVKLEATTAFKGDRVALEITVADTGPGIAPEDFHKIFRKFSQLDGSMRRNHEGVGLGLSIARSLAELMDGRLMVESSPGQGATFRLAVMLDKVPADELDDAVTIQDRDRAAS